MSGSLIGSALDFSTHIELIFVVFSFENKLDFLDVFSVRIVLLFRAIGEFVFQKKPENVSSFVETPS